MNLVNIQKSLDGKKKDIYLKGNIFKSIPRPAIIIISTLIEKFVPLQDIDVKSCKSKTLKI